MDDTNPVVRLFDGVHRDDESKFKLVCDNLITDINLKQFTLVQLIEYLGVYLVDHEPEKREYGTSILSAVLENIPRDFLLDTQLSYIFTFYADRLKDNHLVIPAVLKGILSLTSYANVPEGGFTNILTALFHNVPCQQQQYNDRLVIYKIFEGMLSNGENELKAMGLDFVYGVLSAIDSERDPQNLLFLFNWLPKFLKTVSFQHLIEDMFEVMSCYFPVDFRVPAQESKGISREALATALGPCLTAIPGFSEFCIPLIIEKLTSSLTVAKLDSLELLILGCETFPEEQLTLHSADITSLLQNEIFTGTDNEVTEKCLEAFTKFMKTISQNETDTYKTLLNKILSATKANLKPKSKLFVQTSKMLLAIASASPANSKFFVDEIADLLFNLYSITVNLDQKLLLLEMLVNLSEIYLVHHDYILAEKIQIVPSLCMKAAGDANPVVKSMGFISLGKVSKGLPKDFRSEFYELATTWISTSLDLESRTNFIQCLKTFCSEYPYEVLKILQRTNDLEIYLDSLTHILEYPSLQRHILNEIIIHCTNKSTANIGFKILNRVLNGNCGDCIQPSLSLVIDEIIDWLLHKVDVLNTTVLKDAAGVIRSVMVLQNSEKQEDMLKGHLSSAKEKFNETPRGVYILDGLITCLRPNVLQDFGIMPGLTDIGLSGDETAMKLLANMINKLENDDFLYKIINYIDDKCEKSITIETLPIINKMTTWITKALVMKGHELSLHWIQKLFKLLEEFSETAESFKIIMTEDSQHLCKKVYCNERLLYKQMFFGLCCNTMCERYVDQENYLLAIGYLLADVPYVVLKMNFEKILRFIVLCLDKCTNAEVLLNTLTKLHGLIESKDSLMENYVEEFLPRILKLTRFKTSMKVRIQSIRSIKAFVFGFTLYKLLPHKVAVISTLAECVDDRKRLVRKEAVEARLKWYLIDAPE